MIDVSLHMTNAFAEFSKKVLLHYLSTYGDRFERHNSDLKIYANIIVYKSWDKAIKPEPSLINLSLDTLHKFFMRK